MMDKIAVGLTAATFVLIGVSFVQQVETGRLRIENSRAQVDYDCDRYPADQPRGLCYVHGVNMDDAYANRAARELRRIDCPKPVKDTDKAYRQVGKVCWDGTSVWTPNGIPHERNR